MKIVVVLLGIILLLIGFGLVIYKTEIITYTESGPTLLRETVLVNEVESMKNKGWEEVLTFEQWKADQTRNWESPITSEEHEVLEQMWNEFIDSQGGILMVKEGTLTEEYYITVYPYQIIGAIVALIGFVTVVIGFAISKEIAHAKNFSA